MIPFAVRQRRDPHVWRGARVVSKRGTPERTVHDKNATPMIGERLRRVRQERALSLQQVAKAADISAATLSRIENNKQALEFGLFLRLAAILHCRPADLVDDAQGEADAIEPLLRRLSTLTTAERRRMWERLAETRRDAGARSRGARPAQMAEQVDELLAQLDVLRADIVALQKRLRR